MKVCLTSNARALALKLSGLPKSEGVRAAAHNEDPKRSIGRNQAEGPTQKPLTSSSRAAT